MLTMIFMSALFRLLYKRGVISKTEYERLAGKITINTRLDDIGAEINRILDEEEAEGGE